MKGLADGIEKSKYLVERAISGVSSEMVVNPSFNGFATAGEESAGGSFDVKGLANELKSALQGVSGSCGDIVIPVYLGGTMLDEVIINAQKRNSLRSGAGKMAFMQYIVINGVNLPMPDSYDIEMKDVEADSGGETEAGTKQRDIVRMGVTEISITFSVTSYWLKKLTEYKQMSSLTVKFFNPNTSSFKTSQMYIDGYKVELVKDTSYKGLWKISFKLKEF